MTTDPKDAGIARYDLDLMESRMVKDQWGGEWVRHSDHAAEIARLREERDRFEAALGRACQVGGTTYLVERAEKADAERDAALAQVARLHHLIREASDPDFLWGAMDNVLDMDADITEFANAASQSIRASIPILAAAEKEASP